MPSSYTSSARFTLQATGENNNTWGVILNSGVFQLVDDNVNGRLGFALSGAKILTTALGGPDEARMAFLDVTGGTGGAVTIPAVPKGYFVRNGAAGDVTITAGGATAFVFKAGDAGPVQTDGAAVYGLLIAGQTLQSYVNAGDAALKIYIDAAIGQGLITFPPAAGNVGKVLIVRTPLGVPTWVPDFIQTADVAGFSAALTTLQGQAIAFAVAL